MAPHTHQSQGSLTLHPRAPTVGIMCTLIIGNQVLGPGTVTLAANRDEDRSRPSDPPGILSERPRLVGGRDRVAGGTWLAIRERQAAVAMLNRRDRSADGPTRMHDGNRVDASAPPPLRSRGLLTLDVASAGVAPGAARQGGADLSRAALDRVLRALGEARYAPFSLAFLSPDACWVLGHDGDGEPRVDTVSPGWHVITHADLDDAREPRTAWLLGELSSWKPRSWDDAERGLVQRLSVHGAPPGDRHSGTPAVCIHDGRMVTVSCSVVALAPHEARYRHAEGQPCTQSLIDYSALLAADRPVREGA